MPTNEILNFAQGGSANVETQADYAIDALRTNGNQPGVAVSAFNNKALRQACWIASVLSQFIVNSSGSDVLDDGNQSNLLAAMALTWSSNSLPTFTKLTTTGAAAGYLFTCSSANATVGATYTNNGHTYTVLATLASGTQLFCSGASAPTSTGTLTKSAGTGDSTITFSLNQALAVYTPPANTRLLKIKMTGGGGGAAGGGASSTGQTAGTTTAFGSNFLIANGGGKGQNGNAANFPDAGGSAIINTGATGLAFNGTLGGTANEGNNINGGTGGQTPFGGQGQGGYFSTAGSAAQTNTGSGGGGGNSGNGQGGSGGSAGAYIEAMITTIASSYYYCIGLGGLGGTGSGSNIGNGGAGADGIIAIEEYYSG